MSFSGYFHEKLTREKRVFANFKGQMLTVFQNLLIASSVPLSTQNIFFSQNSPKTQDQSLQTLL